MKRLLAVLLVLSFAACGYDDETTADGPDSPVTGAPDGDGGGDDGGGGDGGGGGNDGLINPTPGLNGVTASAIDSAVLVADDKLEVAFFNGVRDCYGVDRVEVEETDVEVTVTVFTGTLPAAVGRACIEIAELQKVVVALDAPLGERTLVDGSGGTPVAVG